MAFVMLTKLWSFVDLLRRIDFETGTKKTRKIPLISSRECVDMSRPPSKSLVKTEQRRLNQNKKASNEREREKDDNEQSLNVVKETQQREMRKSEFPF